jgi:hypothetical protein
MVFASDYEMITYSGIVPYTNLLQQIGELAVPPSIQDILA